MKRRLIFLVLAISLLTPRPVAYAYGNTAASPESLYKSHQPQGCFCHYGNNGHGDTASTAFYLIAE